MNPILLQLFCQTCFRASHFKQCNVEVKTEELIDLAQILGNERLEIENELEKIIVLIKNSDKGSILMLQENIDKKIGILDWGIVFSFLIMLVVIYIPLSILVI